MKSEKVTPWRREARFNCDYTGNKIVSQAIESGIIKKISCFGKENADFYSVLFLQSLKVFGIMGKNK